MGPWSAAGVLESPDSNAALPTYMAYGALHHAWAHLASEISQPAVVEAKAAVQAWIMAKLQTYKGEAEEASGDTKAA